MNILSGFNSTHESITLCRRLLPEILCKTFGNELSILVPLPAANIATLNMFIWNPYLNLTLNGELRHSPLLSPLISR